MKTILYSSPARDFIAKLDAPMKQRMKKKLESLASGKTNGIFLHKPLQNYQKLRIGTYRIIFQEKGDDIIFVTHVEHRSKVYSFRLRK